MHPHYYITTPIVSVLSRRGTRDHRIVDIIATPRLPFSAAHVRNLLHDSVLTV